jgi:hypothetical protein
MRSKRAAGSVVALAVARLPVGSSTPSLAPEHSLQWDFPRLFPIGPRYSRARLPVVYEVRATSVTSRRTRVVYEL